MKTEHPALPVAQAQRIISEWVRPLDVKEKVPLKAAFFRVLGEDITSPIDVPLQDNAAMDGYAFSAVGMEPSAGQTLKIAGTAFAGHRFDGALAKGECVHIMTGAMIPDGCDTVIQRENVTLQGDTVTFPAGAVERGANVRQRGEDVKAGETCLKEGTLLQPAHLGLLASLGMANILVNKRPVVAIFSTGDELRPVGTPLAAGGIYDSNRFTLYGMVKRLGCDIIDMGTVRDEPQLIRAAFLEAADKADAIITTGGVSVGEADYTKDVMADLAEMAFWHINMRPGRPMAFGRMRSGVRQPYIFGLPGNPVAVMTTFYFFVRDALCYLMGTHPAPLPRMRVKTISPLAKRQGRTEYQRGILSPNEHGDWVVRTTGAQGSGMLSSMTQANCMIILPAEGEAVPAGDTVEIVPFVGLV